MELIVAIVGTVTAVLTVSLTNFFLKRNQQKFEERKLKEEYYISYIKSVSDNVVSHSTKSKGNLADSHNKLLLIASSEVVSNLMIFHDYIKPPNDNFDPKTHDMLLTKLITSMRDDLFSSNKVNKLYPLIHLCGTSKIKTKKE